MKYKLLLLILSFSIVLISCKKDKQDDEQPAAAVVLKQKVLGNWTVVRATTETYDASGKLIKSQEEAVDNVQTWEFFDNNSVNSYDTRGTRTYTYSFTSSNSTNYISITNNPTETYKVSIENNVMTWVLEDSSNDPSYATARLTYYFNKK